MQNEGARFLGVRIFQVLVIIAWIFFAVLGLQGIAERLWHGHHAANYGSYVVWGLWVSAYIYFIGLSAGAFLLSSLIYVFDFKQLENLGRLSLFVAIVTLFMALLSIWFDLGRMDRFYNVFLYPNFTSMMAWMVWLYTIYTIIMILELWFSLRPDLARMQSVGGIKGMIARALAFSRGPLSPEQEERCLDYLRILAITGVPLAITFHGGVGALFSTLAARPFWHTPLMPILFLTGALVSGGALMTFIVAAFWKNGDAEYREMLTLLGKVVLGLLIFDVVLEWAEYSIPMWYGVGHEVDLLNKVLFGEFWWVFWLIHLGLGTLVPLLLLVFGGDRPAAVGLAGLLIAITFMTVRLNIVIPGLIVPHLRGLESAYVHPRLVFHYVPSFFEWKVTFFVVAVGMTLFFLGYWLLPLIPVKDQQNLQAAA